MRVYDPGHLYEVANYDARYYDPQFIRFVKREGPGYPGNVGHGPGTNCQELLRVLIDRTRYLQQQVACVENNKIEQCARIMLLEFERRAARQHGRALSTAASLETIEALPTCATCGHVECKERGHVYP